MTRSLSPPLATSCPVRFVPSALRFAVSRDRRSRGDSAHARTDDESAVRRTASCTPASRCATAACPTRLTYHRQVMFISINVGLFAYMLCYSIGNVLFLVK